MADNREQIRFDIIFNTRAALDEIAAMSNSADNFEQRITRFGNYLIQSSKKWGVPIKDLQRDFMNLDESMKVAGEKGGLPEGLFPGQNAKEVFGLSDAYIRATEASRIMDVLADAELLAAVRARHAAGVVVGGTSAGAAVMSARMITGDGDFTVIDGDAVGVRPGLGLVEGVIVDQHFVKRQRENRLFGLVLNHPEERGVGIDEETALLVTNGTEAEVVGKGPVVLVDAKGDDRLEIRLVRAGARFDLRR